jgi:hypothetical protein
MAYFNCHFRPPVKMTNNPYSVEITADETHSVNRREFVVFGQSLVMQMKNKSILIFQSIEISVFTANIKHKVSTVKNSRV